MSIRQDIGPVSAYALAVEGGYQGTQEEFNEAMARIGTNISEIREAIDEFNQQTVPTATQSIIDEGAAQVSAVRSTGAAQIDAIEEKGTIEIAAVSQTGNDKIDEIITTGDAKVNAINVAGSAQTRAVNAAGATQLNNVNTAGETQVSNVNSAGTTQVGNVNTAGTTQVAAVESAGATQTGNVNTAGETQVAAVEAKGAETLESIPDDYSKVSYLQELLHDEVADTVQEYTFVGGSVSQIKHKRGNLDIRTDVFAYGDGTITETRTLNSGQSVTIETNLATLETAVTYTE